MNPPSLRFIPEPFRNEESSEALGTLIFDHFERFIIFRGSYKNLEGDPDPFFFFKI